MSKNVISEKAIPLGIYQTKERGAKRKKDIRECLNLLQTDALHLEDVEGLGDELMLNPQLGDVIQFQLHKYLQKGSNDTNADLIIKLAELCYSQTSVSHFDNIHRFVGCAYYVSGYLLKKERYKPAIDVMHSLLIRKKEIIEYAKEKKDIRTFLCNMHGSFISSALFLISKIKSSTDSAYQTCHSLAMESLTVINLIGTQQIEVGKKLLKTSLLYLQTIKHYSEESLLEFYKELRCVLQVLLPEMKDIDFFWFYIYKMHQVKKSDAEVPETLRKTIHFITIFLGSLSEVKNILNKLVDFFWSDCSLNNWISDEEFQILIENKWHSAIHFLLVSSIFSYGIQVVWTMFENSWSDNVSVLFIKKLSETIMTFHKLHCGIRSLYCVSVKVPFELCFGDLLNGNLQRILYTVRLCLKNKIPDALSLVSVSREAFDLSMKCLENMESFGCCKDQTKSLWKFSVIHHTNLVEDIYKLPPSDEGWAHIKECSHEILREIVNSDTELPIDFARVKVLFQRWHTGCMKLKNFQQALYVCLVYFVFYPTEERDIMAMWLQTKSESANEIFEEITMSEMIKTCDKSLKEFNKTYNRADVCIKSALLMELKAYSTCLPDTFENPNSLNKLANKIWKQLEKFKLDLWESCLAMSALISVSIAGDDEKLPNGFHDKCQRHIDELMECKEKNLQCRNLLHAANLIFSLFLYNVKMAEKSEGKMDTTQMVLGYLKKAEQEKVKFGEDVDLNLNCDVIPSSKHLTVDLETNYLNELNKIVDLWSNALKNGVEDLPLPAEFDSWLRNVKQVAYWYELIGEYQRAFTTWLMFYRIGKLANNAGAILLGLTHLIEECTDVDESGMKEEAELISENLGSGPAEKYILVEYSLAVASNYLKNKKADKCLEYLNVAKKILGGLRTTLKTFTLNAKFWCLVSQFLVVYREYEAVFSYPPGTDVRVMAFKAFTYANGGGRSDLVKSATQSECTELVLVMLQVNLWAYHLHWVYRQTDFMRFFLDDLYQIVQRLFLPTRTAEMLVRLAEVDVICERTSDCQEKIIKLKSVLTTLSQTCYEEVKPEKAISPYLSVPQGGDLDVPIVRPISPARFIDSCPQPREVDVSPVHCYLNDVKSLKARDHVKKCKCRLCQNLLIQTLTFDTIWLEAETQSLKSSPKEAAKCYGKASEILDKVEHVRDEQSKILRLELASALSCVPGELDFKLGFVQFHSARFLIRYALFEASSLEIVTENVSKTIQRIGKLMKRFSYEEKLLQWTFAELKLYCVVLSKGIPRPPKQSSPAAFKTINIAKTPLVSASSRKTPRIPKNQKTFAKSPLPCIERKRILFEEELSPSDAEMNTAFVETEDESAVEEVQKLSFQVAELEVNTKTVKKASRDRLTKVQSRKLDFDIPADPVEEKEEKEETSAQKRILRTNRKTEAAAATAASSSTLKRDATQKTVKIYLDSAKDSAKSRKGQMKKTQSKTENNKVKNK